MPQVPTVEATALPGGERIGVMRLDGAHERMIMGPHRHQDLLLLYVERGRGSHRLGSRTAGRPASDHPGLVHDASALVGVVGWAVEFDPLAVGLSHAAAPEAG